MPHTATAALWGCLLLITTSLSAAEVTELAPVAPDVLCVVIHTGQVELGEQVPYEPRPGDRVEGFPTPILVRDGRIVGSVIGPNRSILQHYDRLVGDSLDTTWADRAGSYTITSSNDPGFSKPVSPTQVHRKSKPTNVAQVGPWTFKAPMEHRLYLRLPTPLTPGKSYTISFAGDRYPAQELTFDPATTRSEAVHVSHLGFRPDDLKKVAFLSCWMGTGGGIAYEDGLRFDIVDAVTNRSVLSGTTTLGARKGAIIDARKVDYNLTDVHVIDFSDLTTPGTYRVVVEGVGCSYPFPVAPNVWRDAFRVAARGFYHQRSGIELGPPYTDYRRPRCFHPDDGTIVYHSDCPLIDSANGLNGRGTDKDNFGNLVAGKTDRVVPDAWGGYFDAGDYDRRIQHLSATRLQLELAEMFPEFIASMDLNIPESDNDLPDLIDEAMWNLDCYRRMQTDDGGIRGGIEQDEHPRFGEASWQNSLTVMAYAPDAWSSYFYANVAARCALVLRDLDPKRARIYETSALRAMEWAERDLARQPKTNLPHQVNDERNLAAIELFRLTGDERWHALFVKTTVFGSSTIGPSVWQQHDQRDAAFVYARLNHPTVNERLQAKCRNALVREADMAVNQATRTGFGWTKCNPWLPVAWGLLTSPADDQNLIRAHWLTKNDEYLETILWSAQFGAGANPSNLCYTTGLGHVSPVNPLVCDARFGHRTPPPGLTVFGPADMTIEPKMFLGVPDPFCTPPPQDWPATENFFDVFWIPAITEFTIMKPMGPNTYAWGYLAARAGASP